LAPEGIRTMSLMQLDLHCAATRSGGFEASVLLEHDHMKVLSVDRTPSGP